MKTKNNKLQGIMTIMLYHDKYGAKARISYYGGYHKEYEGKNLYKVFSKFPKTAKNFCLKADTKNRYSNAKYNCYSVHFWHNEF